MSAPLPTEVRDAVLARDGYRCVRCGEGGTVLSVHHRKPRGMGGTRRADVHAWEILITLCGSGTTGCHGWVESHRKLAYALGWLVPGWAEAAEWPVRRVYGSVVPWQVPAEGCWLPTEPGEAQAGLMAAVEREWSS